MRKGSEQVGSPETGGDYQHALRSHQHGDLAVAVLTYREILQRDPSHAGAWHFWGVIGLVRGDYASARKRIERALLLCDTTAGCGYSSQSSANWSEFSDWENELTKRHSFSDATWPILWTGRFTSYEQSGFGVGSGSMGTRFSGCGCGCGYGETSTSDRYAYTGCWSESYAPPLQGYSPDGGINNHVAPTAGPATATRTRRR